MKRNSLPVELRSLVNEVTTLWGKVIQDEAGRTTYRKVESLREFLKRFRTQASVPEKMIMMRDLQKKMSRLNPKELDAVTHAFSVLLELINICENASRSLKIRSQHKVASSAQLTNEIYLVLTAHPTESRAPQMVEILNDVQKILSTALYENPKGAEFDLESLLSPTLRRLWYLRMARRDQPQVQDEAEYIYSILFRAENLEALLSRPNEQVYVRTWVGGDKDGHPGVDEKVMMKSLQLARTHLHAALKNYAGDLKKELSTFVILSKNNLMNDALRATRKLVGVTDAITVLSKVAPGDARRLANLVRKLGAFEKSLPRPLERSLISLGKIQALLQTFPSLVVPLELRESSDVFREGVKSNPAIFRMLKTLGKLAGSADPRGYARGLIISMTENFADLEFAEVFLKKSLGRNYILPLIPLFERPQDLDGGPEVVEAWVRSRRLKKMEVMLGYSDSAKEGGVLPSRLAIREALLKLERIQKKIPGLQLTYFHGSGGSVARGGGSLEEQTAHWPKAAFDRYKVTLQGEMIQRTFSTPEIFNQYLTKVRTLGAKARPHHGARTQASLRSLSNEISRVYRATVSDPNFLHMVQEASAYRFLEELRFGSRPTKRKKLEGVSSLRAIPWILSWTQTRNLLPTWWGFGSAYEAMNPKERKELRKLARGADPLFASYLHQLGFTFAKIEPEVWCMYLEQSTLTKEEKKKFFADFQHELKLATRAFQDLSGQKNNLWRKPWLEESIRLRAPLIHPLNVAQLTAWKTRNASLVREASVGIACGMLTTG
ncbi:phosphoenolpyruvate carboxylase [soil metagenome]